MNSMKPQLFIIRKWAWLLALGMLIGAALGYADSSKRPVVFQAAVRVMFTRAADDSAGASSFYYQTQMLRHYAELVNNEIVLKNLQRDLGYQVAASQISAEPVTNTLLMWVYARDDNPRRAAAIANASAQALSAYLVELHDQQYTDIERDLEQRIVAAQDQVAVVQQQIKRAEQANRAAEADQAVQALQNTLTFQQQVYADLLDRAAALQSEKLRTRPQVSLLQPTAPPTTAIPRQRPQTAFTYALVGLMAAGALALTLETIDDRIHTPEDIEQQLKQPVLGLVIEPDGPGDLPASQAEAYRVLCANLTHTGDGAPIRSLLVTGLNPGKAKSTAARNLAWVYAQNGSKTLLLEVEPASDQDPPPVRIPTIEMDPQSAETGAAAGLLPAWGNPPLLAVTLCHPPDDPASAQAPVTLLPQLAEVCDRLVIDAPAGVSADLLALAAESDATLVVVRSGKTRFGPAQLLVEQLQRAGGRMAGVALSVGRGWPYYSRFNDLLRYYRSGKKS